MADISNPQLKDFCNEDLRPFADKLQQIAILGPVHLATYAARDLGTIIEAGGAGNPIADGTESPTDGRTRVTGGDVYQMVTLMTDLEAFLAASGRLAIIAKWQVNGANVG